MDLYDHMVSLSGTLEGEKGRIGLECDVDGEVAADRGAAMTIMCTQ